jgi:hypothetical protein
LKNRAISNVLDISDEFDEQAGHSSKTADDHYARTKYSHLAGSKRNYDLCLDASKSLWEFLLLVESGRTIFNIDTVARQIHNEVHYRAVAKNVSENYIGLAKRTMLFFHLSLTLFDYSYICTRQHSNDGHN